jgi:NDP-sugar pyrophosphorylase family protein
MRVVIPMAGEGRRFKEAGYKEPKPLIIIEGKTMIERVIENLLPLASEFIFIAQKDLIVEYRLLSLLSKVLPTTPYEIVSLDYPTEGAACTILKAQHLIDNEEPILIANTDQIVEYNARNFMVMKQMSSDNFVWVFNATDSKWSFVELNKYGEIIRVAEKEPISDLATCGIYYWSSGNKFVYYTRKMIEKNLRINGEFYVAPVYNLAMEGNDYTLPFYVDEMHGLGTPEDLEAYKDFLRL